MVIRSKVSATIYVLYTGGTFGMAASSQSCAESELRPLPLDNLSSHLQAVGYSRYGLNIEIESFSLPIDSSSIKPEDWLVIAKRIARNYERFDGFVVIHGSDTLAYTASALSFIFENLNKPVVVTGSQVPLMSTPTDAIDNYLLALKIAGHVGLRGKPLTEVSVVFANKVLRGNRCRKVSTSNWSAFTSPNCRPLVSVMQDNLQFHRHAIRKSMSSEKPLSLNEQLEKGVIDIALFPGISLQFLERTLDYEGLRGVVLRSFGAGNAPEALDFLSILRQKILKRNLIVLVVTQCMHGSVYPRRYASGAGLIDCGVFSGGDITPEAALTKLMVLLPKLVEDHDKELVSINMRGEMTV